MGELRVFRCPVPVFFTSGNNNDIPGGDLLLLQFRNNKASSGGNDQDLLAVVGMEFVADPLAEIDDCDGEFPGYPAKDFAGSPPIPVKRGLLTASFFTVLILTTLMVNPPLQVILPCFFCCPFEVKDAFEKGPSVLPPQKRGMAV